MTIERVVVDTNVLISAALRPKGAPRAVLDSIRSMNGVLVFSDETFSELQSRFNRPKFDRYVSQDLRRIWLSQLEAVSEWVSITGVRLGCRDPDDDKVLETALIGDVSCLVTGDHDLLTIPQPPRKVSILTPSAFLELLKTR
ncbi:MAG: putative toxin-antitoxin system toxin component, PIN family [Gammaproteobacteria bacterium]|nr:putative toxin-antitoxin system toxin component, PIN family [Gammaproteobacteria bacterium]